MAGFNWRSYATEMAQKYGVRPSLFLALIRAESGGKHENVRSGAGAIGYAQLMPATARGLGVDPYDPRGNLEGGAKYLSQQLKTFKGDESKALAAYNAGPGAVQKYGGIPPYSETQTYVKRVLGYAGEGSGVADRPGARVSGAGGSPGATYGLTAAQPYTPTSGFSNLFKGGSKQDEWFGQFMDRSTNNMRSRMAAQRLPVVTPGMGGSSGGGGGEPTRRGPNVRTGKGVPARKPGETGQQYLDRIATSKFGLKHDPGNSQTTGGRHSANSYHYRGGGQATDFGDVRNSEASLSSWEAYLRENRGALGLSEVLDEGDHIHAATTRGGRGRFDKSNRVGLT